MSEALQVALITGSATGIPAFIAAMAAWRNSKQARDSVGSPNGQGNIVQMSEKQLLLLGRIDERLNHHIADHRVHRRLSE